MNLEKLNEMANGFEEMIQVIENGEMSINDLKEILNDFDNQVDSMLPMLEAFASGVDIEGISEIQKIAIKASIDKEILDFNYKEQKKAIVTMLKMVDAMDKRLNENIFLDFFIKTINKLEPTISLIHPEAGKAMKKGVKKFKKIKEQTESTEG